MDQLVGIDVRQYLGDEKDQFGESLTDHSRQVLRHLEALRLGDDCNTAAALASSENNAAIAQRVRLTKPAIAAPILTLFEQIYRARQIAMYIRQTAKVSPSNKPGKWVNSDEAARKLLVGLAIDLRIVIVLLHSRLQTLRFHAQNKHAAPTAFAQETLEIYAPLANRLGMWSLKWELEDLAFRFAHPPEYKNIAASLAAKRSARETVIETAIAAMANQLAQAQIPAKVTGRPKHIYSIYNKMRVKNLSLDQIHDLLALRVVVEDEQQCYKALSVIQSAWPQLESPLDDYIARPKANGYRSLHTVVAFSADQSLEVQIRTQQMHEFAEVGAAAHWRYKESSVGTGNLALEEESARRLTWVKQLLAWQQDLGQTSAVDLAKEQASAPILVLTPEAKIIELPAGSSPVDFAYHVHSNLGHRCRGARVDGALVPLNRLLKTGQTVEIIVAKRNEAIGPSRDWLNPELGYVVSSRARTKVRVWFNEQEEAASANALAKLPASSADASRKLTAPLDATALLNLTAAQTGSGGKARVNKAGQVLVVGVDLLLTQLARCCRPMPPDHIVGYVTRGKGISIHRADCASFRGLQARSAQRTLETEWDPNRQRDDSQRYEVQVQIEGAQIPTLLRDVTDVLARERAQVSVFTAQVDAGLTRMRATLAVQDQAHFQRAMRALSAVKGVLSARRR